VADPLKRSVGGPLKVYPLGSRRRGEASDFCSDAFPEPFTCLPAMTGNLTAVLSCLLGATLCVSAPAEAVYKWVDEDGKVHYGDRPGGAESTRIKLPDSLPVESPASGEREDRTRKLLDVYADERAERAEQQAKRKAEEAERKQNCAKARDLLDQYLHASYLYKVDAGGERHPLSFEERAKAEAEAQKAVDHWCKAAP